MKKKFAIFWLSTERKIYGDDHFYVLGELMRVCDTKEEAEKLIESYNLSETNLCTIIEIYSGEE